MPTKPTPEQQAVIRKARRAAEAAGKKWVDLSKDERKKYRLAAKERGSAKEVGRAVRIKARQIAETQGKKWGEMTADQRRQFFKQARQA
jgi:hypothetical protein